MKIIKRCIALLIIALVAATGIFFFFYRMYQNDVKALTGFSASYKKFDEAISDYSLNGSIDAEVKATRAYTELKAKADYRISSLIKNDAKLVDQARRIADLTGKELESLKIVKSAIRSKQPELDMLIKAHENISSERKAAFARFQALAGQK